MATAAVKRTGTALIVLLGVAVFLNYVDRGAIGIAAPLMTKELGLSATAFGLTASAFYWAYGPIQLIVGWLVDRFSVYRLMSVGLLVWAFSTMAMGLVGGFVSLLVLRILLGIGESVIFPGSSKIIAEHVPADARGMANAAVSIGIALGPAIGTLAGGLILAAWGWRPIFLIFGVATLLWLAPWQRAVAAVEDPGLKEPALEVPVTVVLRRWSLWSMSIAHTASNYVFYFLIFWLPSFLTGSRGLSIREMTMLATLGFAAQAVAALGFGWWSDRWTRSGRSEASIRRWTMAVTQVVQAAAVVGILLAGSRTELALWLVIAGICTGALSLNIYAVAQMFAGPRAAGTWIGVQNAIGNSVSGIAGLSIIGLIVDLAGYDGAFYVAAAIAAAGGLWWLVGVPRIRQLDLR